MLAVLYWARPIVLPLALAALLAFLLSPIVDALRRWGLPDGVAVVIVVVLACATVGAAGWALTAQFGGLAGDVPKHTEAIKRKIAELRRASRDSKIEDARGALHEVVGELEKDDRRDTRRGERPVPVVVRDEATSLVRQLPGFLPTLATAGLTLVLVGFMLLERTELRNRIIRIVGHGRLTLTTRALDEAGLRIGRYLLTQSLINVGLGLSFALGLLVLGVPYALLWGSLIALGRFVPFVGVWLAALFPAALSLAVFDTWLEPLLVLALFVALETVAAVVVEPLLLSQRAGLSRVALLFAIAFWTWMWGPAGLVLATPITACLVVFAKYIPELEFLSVLLGDKPALPSSLVYYQRLVAEDRDEAEDIAEKCLEEDEAARVFDAVLIPALVRARIDRIRGRLDPEQERFVIAATRDILETHAARAEAASGESPGAASSIKAVGCPARDEADAVALSMFQQLVDPEVCALTLMPPGLLAAEIAARIERERPALVFIAALPPAGVAQTRYLLKRVRARGPELKILVGRWGADGDRDEQRRVLLAAGADEVGFTLAETRDQLLALVPVLGSAEVKESAASRLQPTGTG